VMSIPLSLADAVYQLNFERGPVSLTGCSLFVHHDTLTPQQFTVVGEVYNVIPLDVEVGELFCTCIGYPLKVCIVDASGVACTFFRCWLWTHNV
jgi:hypothetical protein